MAGGAFLVGGIQSFSGVDGANPIDAESGQTTVSSTNHDTPSITTSMANTMLVTSHTYASSRSWTAQAGLAESFERLSGAASATGQSITGTRQAQAAAGASGTKRATATSSADVGNTHILALRQVQAQVQALHFIHVDHLNTPRLVANQSGQTVWRWDQQEPFGVNVPDENPYNQMKLNSLFTVPYYSPPTTNVAPAFVGIGTATSNAISNLGNLKQ